MTSSRTTVFESGFLDAAASCALRNGKADSATLENYFQTKVRVVDYPGYSNLSQRMAQEPLADPRVVTVAKETTQALSPVHFLYMDVGCWAGRGEDKDTGIEGWTKHREFGVVYGHLVLLCAFADLKKVEKHEQLDAYGSPLLWNPKSTQLPPSPYIEHGIARHPDWPKVKQLLDRLSDSLPGLKLYVLGASSVASPYVPAPRTGNDDPIRIFIGDMHAPVATSPKGAHIVENGLELLRGRLEVNSADLHWLLSLAADPLPVLAPKIISRVLANRKTLDYDKTASSEMVDNWLRLYHVDKKKTADIFENAGADLRAFADALAAFHAESWPLEIVQLGDLFDLWLGFERAFGEKMGTFPALDDRADQVLEFTRFWIHRTLFETDQGPHLLHFLTINQWAKRNRATGARLSLKLVYGNHDNYRKHGHNSPVVVPVGHEHAGLKIDTYRRPSFMEIPGLWAEHGHQPDDYNWDDDPSSGHQLTQVAFFLPVARQFEGPAGWASSIGDGNGIQRVKSIKHALDRCLLRHATAGERCRGIYVLGHTHEAMLKRVELWPYLPSRYRR